MRLAISSSVLFSIGPSEIELVFDAFHVPSILYAVYSALLYLLARRPLRPLLSKVVFSADAAWVALLILFSDNISLAFLFLFSTVITAFQWSFLASLRLTLLAANFSAATGFMKVLLGADLEHHEIVLPPLYLVVFGYLLACWGARELAARRRLVLLKEISRLSNPRFGVDRIVGTTMERLRSFYDADTCLIVASDSASDTYTLRRASTCDPERASQADAIPAETAQMLLALPRHQAVTVSSSRLPFERWQLPAVRQYVYDISESRRVVSAAPIDDMLIAALDTRAFISVPLHYRDGTFGRLYLTRARGRGFSHADMSFLLQVIEQMLPVIENIRMLDKLASNAAAEERRRLARDIHDTMVQTFIGYQLGLAAVRERIDAGVGDLADNTTQLMATTDQIITTLRSYIHRIPSGYEHEGVLLDAVSRFVGTFYETTQIEVQVEATEDLRINDRLAAEVFQMIVEGLSNIRRHTRAACASIGLTRQDDYLRLQIGNDGATAPVRFIPRSISERAAALGGWARVDHIVGVGTQVIVEIPL
jgi:signal transduction histidine kinase